MTFIHTFVLMTFVLMAFVRTFVLMTSTSDAILFQIRRRFRYFLSVRKLSAQPHRQRRRHLADANVGSDAVDDVQ
jgi:hypothetical protein